MEPHRVALVGGAGKMGSGIALALLTHLHSELTVMDLSRDGLHRLQKELIEGLKKVAEKKINALRAKSQRVSNEEVIEEFVQDNLRRLHLTTELSRVSGAGWVFEAIFEDVKAKTELFKMIRSKGVLYFSNSSSIPISVMADLSGLSSQLIGFHFYNPVPQKKLIELVIPPAAKSARDSVESLCKKLEKTSVEPNDIAGFIGNGYFLREVLFAEELVKELKDNMDVQQARSLIDFVTEKLLVRPMGIYRLIQFIGIETLKAIGKIMATYLEEDAFKLNGLNPTIDSNYVPQGAMPSFPHWREVRFAPDKDKILAAHFAALFAAQDEPADLARRLLLRSKLIAEELVTRGVAKKKEDVEKVLTLGFDHLYTPDIGDAYA